MLVDASGFDPWWFLELIRAIPTKKRRSKDFREALQARMGPTSSSKGQAGIFPRCMPRWCPARSAPGSGASCPLGGWQTGYSVPMRHERQVGSPLTSACHRCTYVHINSCKILWNVNLEPGASYGLHQPRRGRRASTAGVREAHEQERSDPSLPRARHEGRSGSRCGGFPCEGETAEGGACQEGCCEQGCQPSIARYGQVEGCDEDLRWRNKSCCCGRLTVRARPARWRSPPCVPPTLCPRTTPIDQGAEQRHGTEPHQSDSSQHASSKTGAVQSSERTFGPRSCEDKPRHRQAPAPSEPGKPSSFSPIASCHRPTDPRFAVEALLVMVHGFMCELTCLRDVAGDCTKPGQGQAKVASTWVKY